MAFLGKTWRNGVLTTQNHGDLDELYKFCWQTTFWGEVASRRRLFHFGMASKIPSTPFVLARRACKNTLCHF